MAYVSENKKKTVEEFTNLLLEYPIVGSVNMENLPAPQLQTMRALLRKEVVIKMTKRRLMKIAIEAVKDKKPGIEKLIDHMKYGMPALLFTKENPFKLYKTIEKNKSPAPAKAGQIAPKDVEVKEGPTPFLPGPIIGELGALGIKSGVEGGKVAIKADTVVVKAGEEISQEVASVLSRLDIQPMEVGLDVPAIYEDGIIYTRDVLSIDEGKYVADLTQAATWAMNLSVEAGYPTKENVGIMITNAFQASKGLALECGIVADKVVGDLLGKVSNLAASLKSDLKI